MLINILYVLWKSTAVIALVSHHSFQAHLNDLSHLNVLYEMYASIYVEVSE